MTSSVRCLTMFSTSFGAGSSWLGAISGSGRSSAGSASSAQVLKLAERHRTQDSNGMAVRPMVKSAIANFAHPMNSAKSMTQLLANPELMNVPLTANGVSDQIAYRVLATNSLTLKLNEPASPANKHIDRRRDGLTQNHAPLPSFRKKALPRSPDFMR